MDPNAAILGILEMREQLLRTSADPWAPQPDALSGLVDPAAQLIREMILVVQIDQGGMAAQRVPYLTRERIACGRVRNSQNVGRSDDMNLVRVKHLPDSAQRAPARTADSGRVRDQVEASPGAGYADIEHAQPVGFPGTPVQTALGHPAPGSFGTTPVLDQIEDHRVELPSLEPVGRADIDLRACPRLI